MKKTRIIIHATKTPAGENLSLDDIEDLNSVDRKADPMPYNYIINPGGCTLKGKNNNELCGHCGKYSRDSLSVAYMDGIDPETGLPANTMNEKQSNLLVFLIKQWKNCYPEARVYGANEILHPDEPPEDNEPYFDVQAWLKENGTVM